MPKTPKHRSYVAAFYANLEENSEIEVIRGHEVIVWRGYVTHVAEELSLPENIETRIIADLVQMNCIQVIRKGVRNLEGVIVLHKPPTDELWEEFVPHRALTRRVNAGTLNQQVKALARQLGGVDLQELAKNYEDRISNMEKFLAKELKYDKFTDY